MQEHSATRRIIGVLLASNSLLSAANIMIFTVASITVVHLAGGNTSWTGIPSTTMLVGAALVAPPIGLLMDAFGRRLGLSLGHLIGIVGAAIAGYAVINGLLIWFLVGIFILGMTRGTIELGRYAAAEASLPARRGRAVSLIVLGGTVGSIAGPSLIGLAHRFDIAFGLPDQTGLWGLVGIFMLLGTVMMFGLLRPDPQEIGLSYVDEEAEAAAEPVAVRTPLELMRSPSVLLAVAAMVFSQVAMVVVMTITPVHMDMHHYPIEPISLVIMAHTLGMFGLSFVTGWLVDRIGRVPIILVGSIMSAIAAGTAPFSTAVPWLAFTLFLLGLGWNFGFVAGSTLLDDALHSAEKGRVQGGVDMIVKLASGAGSLGSGVMFGAIGFALTGYLTVIVAVIPLLLVLLLQENRAALSFRGVSPSDLPAGR